MKKENLYLMQLIIDDNGYKTVYSNVCKHPSWTKIRVWRKMVEKEFKLDSNKRGEWLFDAYCGFKWVNDGATIETKIYYIGNGNGCVADEPLNEYSLR